MLIDTDKNMVIFSGLFAKDYPELYSQITTFLREHNVKYGTLPFTRDYWCRDYMPIQVNEKRCVQFRYHPDYLIGQERYITDTDKVMNSLQETSLFRDIEVVHCPIVIDGGNITVCRGNDKDGEYTLLIMTDKVMVENPKLSKHKIENEIETAFAERVKFLWLSWEGSEIDKYGHTDAMVRFYGIGDDGRPSVLVNLGPYRMHGALLKERIEEYCNVTEITCSKDSDINWAPMNFLQTDKAIVIPGVGEPTDNEMLCQMLNLYNDD